MLQRCELEAGHSLTLEILTALIEFLKILCLLRYTLVYAVFLFSLAVKHQVSDGFVVGLEESYTVLD